MRRTLATAVLALATGLAALPSTATAGGPPADQPDAPIGAVDVQSRADEALEVVDDLVAPGPVEDRGHLEDHGHAEGGHAEDGGHGEEPADERVDASLALRDLFMARDDLTGRDRERADAHLARPTDGAADPQGFGYTTSSRKKCSTRICVHYVTSTRDKVPSRGWVDKTLRVMNQVWTQQVSTLGYRKPLGDGSIPGNNGGNGKFDVYLKDLGSSGLYGFCAPEYRREDRPWLANGYCVLDNDFAREQFGTKPARALKVTAAHEFFHAVQFAYDYGEDKWFMESSATWIEELYADDANDNRQFLAAGQLRKPHVPLDTFVSGEGYQYGNWLWWEYLVARHGRDIVKAAWNKAGAFQGAPNQYSTQALRTVLRDRGGFGPTFARYAAGNTMPGKVYPEGAHYRAAPAARSWRLSKGKRSVSARRKVDHLASVNLLARPDRSLGGSGWRLRVRVDGPQAPSAPAVRVIARTRKGAWVVKDVALSTTGVGKVSVPFGRSRVRYVTVTLVNASARFVCDQGTTYSCEGRPRDDNKPFQVKLDAVR